MTLASRIKCCNAFADKQVIENDDLMKIILKHYDIHTRAFISEVDRRLYQLVQPFQTYHLQLSSSRPLHPTDLLALPLLNDNRRKQWSVSYNMSPFEIVPDVCSIVNGLQSVNLNGCERMVDASALGEVTSLNLAACYKITDVSALGRVTYLNLPYCKKSQMCLHWEVLPN